MAKTYPKCNVCGIPESEWVNGKCRCVRSVCDMTDDVIIEQRVYDCAKRLGLLRGEEFSLSTIYSKISNKHYKLPKYFRDAISREGRSYASLKEFPVDKVMLVCHDGDDGTFQVGTLVWRNDPGKIPGNLDGINFAGESACLDEEFCESALRGAMFEETYFSVKSMT